MSQHSNSRRQESPRSMPLSACCLALLFLALSLKGCQAVLTTLPGTSGNRDSTYPSGTQWNGDWPSVIDGFLSPFPYSDAQGMQKCFANSPHPYAQHSYMSIVFPNPVLVRTIFLVNREGASCARRLLRTEFYVGFNSSPWLNTACGINPTKSGVYFCNHPNGLVGTQFSIYKDATGMSMVDCDDMGLNFCELRLYSYIPLGYESTVTYTFLTNSLQITCPACMQGDLMKLYVNHSDYPLINEAIYNENTIFSNGPNLTYEVRFSTDRHVHAVVIYGNPRNDFTESKDWKVTVGSLTGSSVQFNAMYGHWDVSHKEGQEFIVNATGRSVAVIRINPLPFQSNLQFSLRWIGIFSTSTNCSGEFVWTYTADWSPAVLVVASSAYDSTMQHFAVVSDCAVFHAATLSDDSALPSWITNGIMDNGKSIKLTISSSIATGTYTIKQNAQLRDGVTTSRSEFKLLTIKVANCFTTVISLGSQVLATMTSTVTQEAATQTFQDATETTSTALNVSNVCGGFTYSITSYTFLTINQSTRVLTLGSSNMAHIGSYIVTLSATLTNYPTTPAATKTFTVTLVDPCLTTNILLGEISNMTSSVTQAAATQTFTATDSASTSANVTNLCGGFTYSITSYTFLTINQSTRVLTLQSNDMSKIGSHSVTLSATLTDYPMVPAVTKTFTAVLVDPCLTTTLSLGAQVLSNMSSIVTQAAATQTFITASDSAQTSAGLTNLCGDFTYSITQAYPFLSINQSTLVITLQSNDMTKIGSYSVTLSASLSNYPARPAVNQTFTAVLVDPCLTTDLTLGSQVIPTMTSEITSAATTHTFTAATNSASTLAGVTNLCGSYTYSITQSYSFVTINQTAQVLSLFSNNMAQLGSYLVTLSAILTSYPARPAVTKSFTAVLTDPCLVTVLTLPTTLTNFSISPFSGIPYLQTFMPATDSRAVAAGIPSLCGQRVYQIVEATPAIITTIVPPNPGQEYTSAWTLSELSNSCADSGVWTMTLRAILLNYPMVAAATKVITATVSHQCCATSINTTTLATSLTYQIIYSAVPTVITSFMMNTDSAGVAVGNPMVCGAKKYSTAKPWLSVITPANPATQEFQIVIATNDYSLASTHTINLDVSFFEVNWTGTLTQTFTLRMLHPCKLTTITTSQTISPITFLFGGAAVLQAFNSFSDSIAIQYGVPDLCKLVYKLTLQAEATAYGVSVISGTPNQIRVQTNVAGQKGKSISLILSANSTPQQQDTQSQSVTFWVNIQDTCPDTIISFGSWLPTAMTSKVTQTAATQTFQASIDSLSTTTGIPSLCGNFIYSITQEYSFMTINQTTRVISLQSNNMAHIGSYTATLAASLMNYPLVSQASLSFTVVLVNPCQTTTLTLPSSLQTFTITSFTRVGFNQTFMPATDSAAISAAIPSLCGPRLYEILELQPQNFVKIVQTLGDPYTTAWTLEAMSNNLADAGVWTITLQASLLSYPTIASVKQVIISATVIDPCNMTHIMLEDLDTMSSFVLGSATTFAFTEATDSQSVSYGQANVCGGFVYSISPTTFLSVDGQIRVITLSSSDMAAIGSYTATLTAKLTQYPAVLAATQSFTAVLIDPCLETSIPSFTLPTMTVVLNLASVTQSLDSFFINSVAASKSMPTLCGSLYTVSLSPTQPFLTYSAPKITGSNADNTQLGLFSIKVTIALGNYCSTSTTWIVISTCTMQAPVIPFQSVTIKIGKDRLPYSISFTQPSPVQTCGQTASMTSTPSTLVAGGFVSLTPNLISGGSIKVDSLTLAEAQTYTITLTNVIPGLETTLSTVLQVIIADACIDAIFETSPNPIGPMYAVLASTVIVEQAFKIFTDLERLVPSSICPVTAQVVPARNFISIDNLNGKILVDTAILSQLIPASVTTHAFELIVKQQRYPTAVPPASYSFELFVTCVTTSIELVSSSLTDTSYEINPTAAGKMLLPLPVYRCLPCFQSTTYTRALVMDQAPQEPLSRFVTTADAEGVIQITISNPQDTGQYQYRVVVKETNGPVNGPGNDQVTFKLTLTCTVKQFFNKVKSLSNIVYTIPSSLISPADIYAMPVYETNPAHCQLQDIESTLVFEDTSVVKAEFIEIDNSVKPARVIVKENDPSKVGTYSFHIHAVEPTTGLIDETVAFKVTITCLIEDFAPVLDQKTVKEMTYAIRSAPVQFTLPSYSWKPKSCRKDVRFKLVIENELNGKFPPFFKVNFESLVVNLNGGRDHHEFANQEFQFRLIAETTDSQNINSDYSFSIRTTFKNSPPKFLDPLETQKFFVGQKYEVLLPEITDEDGDEIKTISITPKLSWIQLRRENSQLRIFADLRLLKKDDVGNTDFKITLTDEFGGSRVIKQPVMVLYDANQLNESTSSTSLASSNQIKSSTGKTNSAPEPTNATAAKNTTDASNKTDVSNETSASNATDDASNATDDGLNTTASANETSQCPADNSTDSNSTDCATNTTQTEEASNSTASNETNSSEEEDKPGTENTTASAYIPAAGISSSEPNKKDKVKEDTIVKFNPVQVIVPNFATSFVPPFKVKPSWQTPKFNLTADENAEPEVFTKLVEGRCAVTMKFSQDMDLAKIKDPGLVFEVMIVVYKDKASRQLAGTDQAQNDVELSSKNLTTVEIDEDVDTIDFSWVLKQVGATEAEFEVEFTNPYGISVGNTLHVLQIKQKEGTNIFTTKGVPMTNISIEDKLPAQITPGDQNMTSNINAYAGSSSKIAMLGTLIVSMIAGQSLAMLFGMVGSLQFILYLSILNTNFPGNANDVFKKLLNIVTFDYVPDFIMTPWYELVSKKTNNQDISQQFNQRFDQMGYNTSNWVVNMGSNSLFLGIILAQMIVLPLLRGFLFALRCQRKIRLKIKEIESTLYWNQPTRFFVELFFELTLICAIRFQTSEQDTRFEQFFTYAALAVLLSLVVFAWYIAHTLIHIRRFTENEEVEAEYGTLYEGLDPSNRIGFMNTPFFCLCRLINIVFMIFYQKYVTFQLIMISLVSFVQVWFSTCMPYKRKLTSIIELMNQICTYIITVFCFSLTDHVPHAHMRYKFGWAIISIVGFFIVVNILVQTYDIVLSLIEEVRQIYFKYRKVPGPNVELKPKPSASQQENGQTHSEAEASNTTRLVTRTQTDQPVIQRTNLKPINQLVIDDEYAINNETSQIEELDRDKGFMLDIHFDQPKLLKPKQSLSKLGSKKNTKNLRVKTNSVIFDEESLSVVAVLKSRSKKHSMTQLFQDLDDLEEQKVARNPDYEDDEQKNQVNGWSDNNINMSMLAESDIIRRYNQERQQDKNLKTERKASFSLSFISEEVSDDE